MGFLGGRLSRYSSYSLSVKVRPIDSDPQVALLLLDTQAVKTWEGGSIYFYKGGWYYRRDAMRFHNAGEKRTIELGRWALVKEIQMRGTNWI